MLPVTDRPKRRKKRRRRQMTYNPFKQRRWWPLPIIFRCVIPVVLFLVLSFNNIFISLLYRVDEQDLDSPGYRSLESFRNHNVGTAISSKHARVMTMDEIIRLQESANEKVPRLRKLPDRPSDSSDKLLSKIKNEFEHDEPKPEEDASKTATPKEKKKKFFVIHVGPPATGAERFQKDTALNPGLAEALEKDGVLYAGEHSPDEIHNSFINEKICTQVFLKHKLDQEILDSIDPFGEMPIAEGLPPPDQICTTKKCLKDCWSDEIDNKLVKNKLHYNGIILSNEKSSWIDGQGSLEHDFSYEETGIFKDYLDFDEIIGVAAYRRYYSWLLAVYKDLSVEHCTPEPVLSDLKILIEQGDLADRGPIDDMTILWAYQNHFRKNSLWPEDGGSNCPHSWAFILPHVVKRQTADYRSRVFQNIDETVPIMETVLNKTSNVNLGMEDTKEKQTFGRVEILNYYQTQDEYNSITTEFYCRILGKDKTPHTCEYAKKNLGPKGPKVSLVNELDHYDKIVVAAHKKGFFGTTKNSEDLKIINFNSTNDVKPKYDIIPTTTQRIEKRKELYKYHTETLKKTYKDLPLSCPTRGELQHLLDKSLAFEVLVQPELAKSPLGRETHIADFWDSHERELTFCWVDIPGLFRDITSWDEFLKKSLTKSWGEPNRVKIKKLWVEHDHGQPKRRARNHHR